jgi:GNAT superfamily N-acetyltransferase
MTVRYVEANPGVEDYYRLFLTTGWNEEYGFTPEELGAAIARSWQVVSAYDGDRLVGTGRVISDGIHHALIVDMIVDPSYQGLGIGRAILKRILDRCQRHRIRDVQLFAARGKAGFYQRHGFAARPAEAPGMQLV